MPSDVLNSNLTLKYFVNIYLNLFWRYISQRYWSLNRDRIIFFLHFLKILNFKLSKKIPPPSPKSNNQSQRIFNQNVTSVLTYTKDMSCATTFSQLRGNQETKSFKVYLDCLVADDMHFNSCVDQRETRPFEEILLYSGWLACESRLNAPHLPKCVMRQFGYT